MSRFVVFTPPTTEPLTLAEAKTFARLDSTNAEPAPAAITTVALASPAAAGNVDNGAHRYLTTFVTADGETDAGVVSSAVTVADKTVNGKVQLTGIPLGGSAVTSRKLYRTAAAGSTYLLLAALADNTTTTYLDNTADSGLGVGAPTANTTGDPLLADIITIARQLAEQELRRGLITQTVDLYLDAFPGRQWPAPGSSYRDACAMSYLDGDIRLPPVQSVTSIEYVDGDGNTVTLDPTTYTVDTTSIPARITPVYGTTWPYARPVVNAVKVRHVQGYGATAASVPRCVKHWMAMQVKALWDNRDKLVVDASVQPIPNEFVNALLDPERVQGRLA